MNPEPELTEIFKRQLIKSATMDTASIADPKAMSQSGCQSIETSVVELDDVSFAKARTLMIDNPADELEEVGFEAPAESFKYIQGVVQGQKVCIITNLLGESEILLQPQMVWTIGRNRDAALPLKDRVMSRRHAVLMYIKDVGFQLIDLNSMNGTFVNGVRIQQRHGLRDGDRIRLGSINFVFLISHQSRTLEAIHPEVLARFNASESRSSGFIDYLALEDPEILFDKR